MINYKRLLVSGLVAGLIVDFITGFANGALLKDSFQVWATQMGATIHPPEPSTQMVLWVLMGLINGFVGVWIYAAMRPRFGAGLKSALHAGLIVWIIGRLCVAFDLIALGIFPLQMMLSQGVVGLCAILPGVVIGAWIYRE